MQSQHSGAMRGLGIAGIALSAISLFLCLLCVLCLAAFGSFVGSPALETLAHDAFGYGGYGYYDYYEYGFGGGDLAGLWGFGLAFAGVLFGWEALTCAVSLAAGIAILRSANDSAKLDKIFGWGLAGSIASLLGGRFITMCVYVVVAVFATRDRSAAQNAYWQVNGSQVSVSAEGAVSQPQPVVQAQQVVPAPPMRASAPAYQQPVPAKVCPQPSAAYVQAYGQPLGEQPAQSTQVAQPVQQLAGEQPVQPADNAQQ